MYDYVINDSNLQKLRVIGLHVSIVAASECRTVRIYSPADSFPGQFLSPHRIFPLLTSVKGTFDLKRTYLQKVIHITVLCTMFEVEWWGGMSCRKRGKIIQEKLSGEMSGKYVQGKCADLLQPVITLIIRCDYHTVHSSCWILSSVIHVQMKS